MLKSRIFIMALVLTYPKWGRAVPDIQELYVGECPASDRFYYSSQNPAEHPGLVEWACNNGCGATWDRGFHATLQTDDLACRLAATGLRSAPVQDTTPSTSSNPPETSEPGPSSATPLPEFSSGSQEWTVDRTVDRDAAASTQFQHDFQQAVKDHRHAGEVHRHNVASQEQTARENARHRAERDHVEAVRDADKKRQESEFRASHERMVAESNKLNSDILGFIKLSEKLSEVGAYIAIVEKKEKEVNRLKTSFAASESVLNEIISDFEVSRVKMESLRADLGAGIPVINDDLFYQKVHESVPESESIDYAPDTWLNGRVTIAERLKAFELSDLSDGRSTQTCAVASARSYMEASRATMEARCAADAACLWRVKAASAILAGLQQNTAPAEQAASNARASGVVAVLDDALRYQRETESLSAGDLFLSGPMVDPEEFEDPEVRFHLKELRRAHAEEGEDFGPGINYGVGLDRGEASGLLHPMLEHMATTPGAPGWDDLASAVGAYQRAAASLEGLAVVQEPQRFALSAAELLIHAADTHFSEGSNQQGRETLKAANSCLSLVMDFIPGVSLAKDLISLFRGIEPITGEVLSKYEMGWIAATIFIPGSIKAVGREGWRGTKIFKKLILGGDRRAEKISSLMEAANLHRAEFGSAIDALVKRPLFRQVAQGWGIGKNGADQLLNHLIGKDFRRLKAIEERSGLPFGSLSDAVTNKSLKSLESAAVTFDKVARKIKARGLVRSDIDGRRKFYFLDDETGRGKGVMLIEFDNLFQSIMPRNFLGWEKVTKGA